MGIAMTLLVGAVLGATGTWSFMRLRSGQQADGAIDAESWSPAESPPSVETEDATDQAITDATEG